MIKLKDIRSNETIHTDRIVSSPIISGYIPYTYNKRLGAENDYKYTLTYESNSGLYSINSYKEVISDLQRSHPTCNFTSPKGEYILVVASGYLREKRSDDILLLRVYDIKEKRDRLFLSHQLLSQERFRILYNRLFKEFITIFIDKGLPIEILSSQEIREKVFPSLIKPLNSYESMEEYDTFMTQELKKYLAFDFNTDSNE